MPAKFATALPPVTAWSISRYKDYLKCPFYFMMKVLRRLKEPGSPAMDRGSEIHKLAEVYSRPTRKQLPMELVKFAAEFKALQKVKTLLTEQQWAFTNEWRPTGWFDKDCWLRVVVDAGWREKRVGRLVDYKTGKIREGEYDDQMETYAIAGFLMFDDVDEIHAELWFLDHGETIKMVFLRAQLPALQKKWAKNVKPMFVDRKFAPKPSGFCRYCYQSKAKNGACKF